MDCGTWRDRQVSQSYVQTGQDRHVHRIPRCKIQSKAISWTVHGLCPAEGCWNRRNHKESPLDAFQILCREGACCCVAPMDYPSQDHPCFVSCLCGPMHWYTTTSWVITEFIHHCSESFLSTIPGSDSHDRQCKGPAVCISPTNLLLLWLLECRIGAIGAMCSCRNALHSSVHSMRG